MSRLRQKLPGHATVAAYLAIFFALSAGAIAAATIDSGDVVNNSLKSVDLKNGGGAKGIDVRNRSLRGNDIRNGQLRGAQVADNSIRGADTNEPSLQLSQRILQLGATTNFAIPTPIPLPFPNNTYTQAADETNLWIAGGQVTFSAACTQPRAAIVYLLDGNTLVAENIVGFVQINDQGAGAVARRFTFPNYPGTQGLTQIRTGASQPHNFHVYSVGGCNSGSGITLDSIGVDVVAER